MPYQSQEIDWDATERARVGSPNYVNLIFSPCIRYQDLSFELCENCGSQVIGGRAKRKLRSCSKECNQKIGGAWAKHTLEIERQQSGKRPMFFWWKIRDECFERDGHLCKHCGKDIRSSSKPGEAHHIVPVSKGGTNELSNLITLCYDCHKIEHSHMGNMKRKHKTLDNF